MSRKEKSKTMIIFVILAWLALCIGVGLGMGHLTFVALMYFHITAVPLWVCCLIWMLIAFSTIKFSIKLNYSR